MVDTAIKKYGRRRPPRFELTGGVVCLDFMNTLDDRYTEHPKELLEQYVDVARFAEDTQILTTLQVDRLMTRSQEDSMAATRALRAAVQLREAMYGVFWAVVNRQPLPEQSLITLNQYVQLAGQRSKLVPAKGHFEWQFEEVPLDLEAPLWPIARSAADLLASDELQFVRPCASKTCLWLFLDTSKNHRRRWCDMTKCGNREKFRSYYRRLRSKPRSRPRSPR